MENQETILRRIQKLFALAGNNPNEQEAQTAMLKAQELLLQHNLSVEQIDTFTEQDKSDFSIKEDIVNQGGGKLYAWQASIVRVITYNFRCKWYIDYANLRFTGRKSRMDKRINLFGQAKDVDVAKETLQFIFAVAPKLWLTFFKKWQETPGNFTWNKAQTYTLKNDYFCGFVTGLRAKFKEQVQSKDLILIIPNAVIEAYAAKGLVNFNDNKLVSPNNSTAFDQGYRDGKGATEKHKYIEENI